MHMHSKNVLFAKTGRAVWADTIYASDVKLGIYVYNFEIYVFVSFSFIELSIISNIRQRHKSAPMPYFM